MDAKSNPVVGVSVRIVEKLRKKWVAFMQVQARKLSYQQQKRVVILFFILAISCSLLTIMRTLFAPGKSSMAIDAIQLPKHVTGLAVREGIVPKMVNKDLERIQRFKSFMDSLRVSPTGKRVWDSILVNRPNLMDSVLLLEEIIYKQKQ